MMRLFATALVVSLLGQSGGPQPASPAPPLDVRMDVQIPVRPAPFLGGGRTHIAYELHITNFRLTDAAVNRIEVLTDTATLASFEGAALNQLLTWPSDPSVRDWRILGRWQRVVAWMWLTLEPGVAVPARLRHRLTVDNVTFELEPVAVASQPPIVIAPPLKGGVWIAINGPGPESAHRLSLMTYHSRLRIPQRFAVDWVREGKSYGAEVLAVADATVVAAVDGIPDNAIGSETRAVPMRVETIAGNYVVLDLGGERYAFYAHLQAGSVTLKSGARVRVGQPIGRVGNSGDTAIPHLHFHVMDGPSPFDAEGVPFALSSFDALAGLNPGRRVNATPMRNARVRFVE